jgi:hypothetical protein
MILAASDAIERGIRSDAGTQIRAPRRQNEPPARNRTMNRTDRATADLTPIGPVRVLNVASIGFPFHWHCVYAMAIARA